MNHAERKYRILVAAPSLKRDGLLGSLTGDPSYQLLQPKTTAETLKIASAGPLDLILVDDGSVSLPELVIRAKGVDADTPILVFSKTVPTRADDRFWTLGIDDCLIEPVTPAKFLHHVRRALKARRLGVKCEELTKENLSLYQLAITDGLTRLVNRRYLMERLQTEFARVKRFGGKFGCIICDIDHFKLVNDTYGHTVGDRVLRGVAAEITKCVRLIDVAGRYGGEEFLLLLPETALEGTVFVAEKVRAAIEAHNFLIDSDDLPGPQTVTISLGCASYPENAASSPDELVGLADHSLYVAKDTGRNRVVAAEVG